MGRAWRTFSFFASGNLFSKSKSKKRRIPNDSWKYFFVLPGSECFMNELFNRGVRDAEAKHKFFIDRGFIEKKDEEATTLPPPTTTAAAETNAVSC